MELLTDLEAAALGCISRMEGCTAYAIRRVFKQSPSSRFSDSAGSVYPMVGRLTRRRYLRTRKEAQGKRKATLYECTEAGLEALRQWIEVPEDSAALSTWDPLRTRVLYLGLLSKAARLRWLEAAERSLGKHAAEVKRALTEESPDRWSELAHRNALLQVRARARWLKEVREAL